VADGTQVRQVGAVNAANALTLQVDDGSPYLPALGLWLDPARAVPRAFVSHAHAVAAARGSSRVLASPETAALASSLGEELPAAETIAWDGSVELPVDPAYGGGIARLSIAAAGHALGAAQLVVEHGGRRLVYTGDWSAEEDGTHPPGAIIACDELAVTSAFALPIFRFEPASAVRAELVAWCAERLLEGVTPFVLAKTPGPAQAIVRALSARGLPVSGDEAVRRACAAYEALGVVLGPVAPHDAGTRGRVVVASAGARATELRHKGRSVVAYASGWALLDAAVEQKRADAAFVLADQADLEGIVSLARATGASRVLATRGDAVPLAHLLREAGLAARPLPSETIDERGLS
jgi:putative mRNA 3-end processing factor